MRCRWPCCWPAAVCDRPAAGHRGPPAARAGRWTGAVRPRRRGLFAERRRWRLVRRRPCCYCSSGARSCCGCGGSTCGSSRRRRPGAAATPGPRLRMQYTASSFADMLVGLFRWGLRSERHGGEVAGLLPNPADFPAKPPTPFSTGCLPLLRGRRGSSSGCGRAAARARRHLPALRRGDAVRPAAVVVFCCEADIDRPGTCSIFCSCCLLSPAASRGDRQDQGPLRRPGGRPFPAALFRPGQAVAQGARLQPYHHLGLSGRAGGGAGGAGAGRPADPLRRPAGAARLYRRSRFFSSICSRWPVFSPRRRRSIPAPASKGWAPPAR